MLFLRKNCKIVEFTLKWYRYHKSQNMTGCSYHTRQNVASFDCYSHFHRTRFRLRDSTRFVAVASLDFYDSPIYYTVWCSFFDLFSTTKPNVRAPFNHQSHRECVCACFILPFTRGCCASSHTYCAGCQLELSESSGSDGNGTDDGQRSPVGGPAGSTGGSSSAAFSAASTIAAS